MNKSRRDALRLITAAGLSFGFSAQAQSKMLHMVVPLTPGTTPDLIARAIGPGVLGRIDMNYVVENRPGASGMIGMKHVAQSTDPATLLIIPATTVTLPFFYKNLGFDVLSSFTPITQVASSSFVLVVGKDVPATNLKEFITWGKSGSKGFYGSPGNGTHHHLFMELLLQATGLKLEHIAYKGSGPLTQDLAGGHIATMFMPIQIAVPLRDGGRLKIIGGSLRERHPGFPEIPSLHEQGATNFHADPWYAVWGAPGVTPKQAETYRKAITQSLNDASVKENLTQQGLILKTSTPDELLAMTREEQVLWTQMLNASGIKPAG
ncbi:MAG TPA: tripartite tricarboxylate transporter substrate binding protein [Eoetvoesiella sp.]